VLLANALFVSLALLWGELGRFGRVVSGAQAALEAIHVQTMDIWVASLID
jgi:hypothetical protein